MDSDRLECTGGEPNGSAVGRKEDAGIFAGANWSADAGRQLSNESLRRMLDALPAGAYMCDASGLITYFNQRAVEIWGRAPRLLHPEDRFCGSLKIFYPDGRPLAHDDCFVAVALREGRRFDGVEGIIERPSGERRAVLAHVSPLVDATGTLIGAANVLVDITEQKRIHDLLIASELRHRQLVEHLAEGVWAADANAITTFVNTRVTELLGYRAEELIGRPIVAFMSPEFAQLVAERQARRQRGETDRGEFEFIKRDGSRLLATVTAYPLFDERGQFAGSVAAVSDVTQQRQAAQELRESEERFRQMAETIDEVFWLADAEIKQTFYVSPAYERVWGRSLASLKEEPRSFLDAIHPDDRPRVIAALAAKRNVGGYCEEYRVIRPNGSCRWVRDQAFPIRDDQGQVYRVAGFAEDITERRQVEQDLRDSEARLNSVWQNSVDGMRLTDASGRIVAVNPAYCRLVGLPREQLEGQLLTVVYTGPQAAPDALARFRQRFAARTVQSREARTARFRTGHTAVLEISSSFVDVPGRPPLLLNIFRDVTERQRAEELLYHSQKMDAIGKLAGGIAHDFNNLLLVILGYTDVLLTTTADTDPQHESLVAITEAAERAASLTRQLLAFSRRTMLEPKILDLNTIVHEAERLLDRLIGKDIRMTSVLATDLALVKADPGQLSQIILNLAVNARDAMPSGGQLTIETANIDLDATLVRASPDLSPGKYVLLAIRDTGQGMSAEVQRRIFEPFFTTKEVGSGTGLGLAVVHGIVKQSGGHIDVASQPGAGTTFRIYFPAAIADQRSGPCSAVPAQRRSGETVLLVEDEDGVRALALEVLRSQDYRVLEACHGLEALRVAECHAGPIDLLLTDVVMPKMDGRDLAEVLRRQYPEMRVMFMSGYTDDEVLRRGLSSESVAFLPKPYTPAALAEKVRQVLDQV